MSGNVSRVIETMFLTVRKIWDLLFYRWPSLILLMTPNLPQLPGKKFSGNSHDRRIGFRVNRRNFYLWFYQTVWGHRWEKEECLLLRRIAAVRLTCF